MTDDEEVHRPTPMTVTPFENYMEAIEIPQLWGVPELRNYHTVENTSYLTLINRYVEDGPDMPNMSPRQASPLTTLRMPRVVGRFMEMPERLREHLDMEDFACLKTEWLKHEADFWIWTPGQQELWRVHKVEGRQLFDPFRTLGQVPMWPHDIPKEWFRGPRSTVVFAHQNIELLGWASPDFGCASRTLPMQCSQHGVHSVRPSRRSRTSRASASSTRPSHWQGQV